jgi:CubicO group peptidase (beta-lactamase class C family)
MNSPIDSSAWQARLRELLAEYGVPGAVLGVHSEGEVSTVPAGVLGLRTRVPVTADAIFQLGSTTKVFTATLVMQLVDDGVLDLDAPVVEVLPEFRVGDQVATRALTPRQLLTHTSGIDGDVFTDTGRGDDCLAKYVAQLAHVEQIHPPGQGFSYCNTGFTVLGRIIERLTGNTWDEVIRERLAAPLGLRALVTLPEQALLHRAAIGHFTTADGTMDQTPEWGFPRSLGPAGGITTTVHDLLIFAQAYLEHGRTRSGDTLLSRASVEAMTDSQIELPTKIPAAVASWGAEIDSWGLGWFRCRWGEHRLFGHDGGAIGQRSYLRILPASNLAAAVLTNGGDHGGLAGAVLAAVFQELAGVNPPASLAPPSVPPSIDHATVIGSYGRAGWLTEVFERGGHLVLRSTEFDGQADLDPAGTQEQRLVPTGNGLFLMATAGSDTWQPVKFGSFADGRRYVMYQHRISPMIELRESRDEK